MKRIELTAVPSLEDELASLVREPRSEPPAITIQSVPDLGKLTSEAVLAQYEHAAKSVEAMGHAVKASIAKLQEAMNDHLADLQLIAKAADHIREKGKTEQAQIEAAIALTKDIRDICAGFTGNKGV